MNDMYNDDAYDAIDDAINRASQKVCRDPKVDLENFDPWAEDSHNFCLKCFGDESQGISEDQDEIHLISYSGTRGWLNGYSCAQRKADKILQDTKNKLNGEISKLKEKLEELKSRDPEKLAKRRLWGFLIVAAIAIAHIISEWQFDWPF